MFIFMLEKNYKLLKLFGIYLKLVLLLIFSLLGLLGKGSYTYSPLNGTALKQMKNYTSDFTNAHLITKFHTFSMI